MSLYAIVKRNEPSILGIFYYMAIVYIHRRNDIQDPFLNVFYVGIGKSEKRAYSKNGRNKHWHNIVNKVGYKIEITHSNLLYEEVGSIEKYLIFFYGKYPNGKLCNITDGGAGVIGIINPMFGKKHTDETKKIFSEQRMGAKNHRYGKKNSEKLRKINSCLMTERNLYNNPTKGKKRPEHIKKLLSNSKKGEKNPNFGKTGVLSIFSKKVYQIDLKNKKIIKTYHSCTDASHENKIYVNSIYKCCAGVNKTAGGYIWEYVK
jgi:hypothetical protein